jgi:tetratricopeptide (TPR) repeat protein
VNPKHLKLLKQAQALDLAGKAMEASVAYRTFLDREPRHADAWADYAGQLLKLGQPGEAQKACDAALAIHPHQLAARINLGCILVWQERLKEAEGQFCFALEIDPRRMDAQLFLADCLLKQGDLDQVQEVLEKLNRAGALEGRYAPFKDRHAELWEFLGLALLEARRYSEAESACSTALLLDPGSVMAKGNLGAAWMGQGRLDQAEECLRHLVAEHPREVKARLVWITCLTRMGNSTLAVQEAAKALQQEPGDLFVHRSVMAAFYTLGHWPEFRAEIDRFREADPASSAVLDFEQGTMDLLHGDMRQGWQRFEGRLHAQKALGLNERTFKQPAWGGESFAGKTLLLWAEQGFGDTFMFLRYLPMVKALGGQVIVEAQPSLMDVAATCQGADMVIPKGAPWVSFDLQSSLMSLPHVFRTDLASIPDQIPYLDVPSTVPHREAIQQQLAQEGPRVGLVWAGTPGHGGDAHRSMPAAALAPLANLSGVAWFSLQLGKPELPPLPNLISLAPLLENFSDTAFALSGLDLLITVDTAVAHLAGALGTPTLLLLPFQPDYRWLLDR